MPDLQDEFARALAQAAAELGAGDIADLGVEPSAVPEAGDYSSAIAFRLASTLRRPPREIAAEMASRVSQRSTSLR
jgi:arginyl-tRNA synthetase